MSCPLVVLHPFLQLVNGTSADKGGTCDVPVLGHALQRRPGTP